VDGLTLTLQDQGIHPDDFVAPKPGRVIHLPAGLTEAI